MRYALVEMMEQAKGNSPVGIFDTIALAVEHCKNMHDWIYFECLGTEDEAIILADEFVFFVNIHATLQ